MVDEAVVGVPGVGIVRLCRAGIAVIDVDLRVGDRGQAGNPDKELKLAGDGVVGHELPLQPGGLVPCRDDDVGAVGAGMAEQARRTIAPVISTGKSVRSSTTSVWSILILWRYSKLGSYQAKAQLPRVPANVRETFHAVGGDGQFRPDAPAA
jgi:hypothetical protein